MIIARYLSVAGTVWIILPHPYVSNAGGEGGRAARKHSRLPGGADHGVKVKTNDGMIADRQANHDYNK